MGTKKFERLTDGFEFRNVEFEYPGRPGELVLRGMTTKLHANKMTAIVGDSGAGKSTIAKLLMRMYDPSNGDAGAVMVDGVDVREYDLQTLHHKIGVVSQVCWDCLSCS